MQVKHIDRVPMPETETFFRKYVYKREPVIITNLFEGQSIRQIKTLEDARSAFGDAKLSVRGEYTSKSHQVNQIMSFNEYWDFVHENPATDLLCTEYSIPASVMVLFDLPSVCYARDIKEEEVLSMPRKYGDHDLLGNLFVGNQGNRAHLHYDGDHRQVLLYQVFGRKQVILFAPENGKMLKPFQHHTPGFSGLSLEHMTEEEKLELVQAAGGYSAIIYPGDAIYIPMLMWHYLEYTDHAMSFNLRFARNKYGRFLCVDNFHRDCYIQMFASRLSDKLAAESLYKEGISSVINAYLQPGANKIEKIRVMRKLFKDLCAKTVPECIPEEYCPPEWEESEIERIIKDLGMMCYENPMVVAQTRPVGAISSTQADAVLKNALKCGYSPGELERLLVNMYGKRQVNLLTKVEASQFLAYMRTPGAVIRQ